MMCKKPYAPSGVPFPCGQCTPCRINKRRVWTGRLMLEAMTHGERSAFVTLTYSDENRPSDRSVSRRAVQLFLKRLRRISPRAIRYFAVGEYGDLSEREHYHLALFGLTTQEAEVYVPPAWSIGGQLIGLTHVGTLTRQSAAYVAGYVTKKMTAADDERLRGRHPEFATMSLRPGIGHDAIVALSRDVAAFAPKSDEAVNGVHTVVAEGRRFPAGRYLSRISRKALGLEPGCSDDKFYELSQRYAAMVLADPDWRKKSSVQCIVDAHEQKRLNQASTRKIFETLRKI